MFTLKYKKIQLFCLKKNNKTKERKKRMNGGRGGRELEHTGKCLFRCQVRCDLNMQYVHRVAGKEVGSEG